MSTRDRQNSLQTIPWTFYQVLLLRLKQNSGISACGFFNVDRSLVTSFLATTFTYWVILVQFQTMWSLFDMQVLHRHILHLICVYHCIRQKNTHFLVQNYVCLLCISHWSHSRETSTQKRWCALGQIKPTSPFFKDTACSFYEIILEHSPEQIKPRSPFFFKIRTCNFRKSVSNIHACISPAWGPCQISFLL